VSGRKFEKEGSERLKMTQVERSTLFFSSAVITFSFSFFPGQFSFPFEKDSIGDKKLLNVGKMVNI
jgi:hypothetical protein